MPIQKYTADHRQIAEDTRGLIREIFSLLGAKADVQVVHLDRDGIPSYLFQLRAPATQLPRLTGPDGKTWQILRALILLIGAHHHLGFELGLADPPGATWMAGVRAEVLRVPVKVEAGSPAETEHTERSR